MVESNKDIVVNEDVDVTVSEETGVPLLLDDTGELVFNDFIQIGGDLGITDFPPVVHTVVSGASVPPVVGTNGNDTLQFQGSLGLLVQTITNPFSGEIININGQFNINVTSYDGLAGTDFLIMSALGDYLSSVDSSGQQIVHNIEFFIAGNGGDIIDLSQGNIGDITLVGGAGDDVLWGNVGNDIISGGAGNDIIDGGPGTDSLSGDGDDDIINGGAGDDTINGGDGNDVLYGGFAVAPVVHDKDFIDAISFPHLLEGVNIANLVPPGTNALGFAEGNMSVDFDAQATLTFREGFAGYNNTLGMYSIAEDGTIEMGTILWGNTKDAGLNVAHQIDLPVGVNGGDFGFFIIANGDNVNGSYAGLDITGEGNISFIFDLGGAGERAATIHDDGGLVSMVYDDGITQQVLSGPHYHTTERGESTVLNADGQTHMISGLVDVGLQDVLRIGFEDLPNLGDADFEDVFFDFNIIETILAGDSEDGNDTLIGGAGDDILYAQDGDDILIIGDGRDDAYGGAGDDQFIYDVADSLVDTIHDFGLGNDTLDIGDILQGFDPLNDVISEFVEVTSLNGDTHISVDVDGGGDNFVQLVTLSGVDTTLVDMLNNGELLV